MIEEKRTNENNSFVHTKNDATGITLISLVITIIVIIIIAGITTTAGLDSVRNAKRTSVITELEMIQSKVDTIYEKIKLNKENSIYYNKMGKDLSFVEQSKLNVILNGKEETGYRYFPKEDLNQLDLSEMTQDVIINFSSRDVASINGIDIDNKICYRLTDIPGYQTNKIQYVDKNTRSTRF